MIAWLFTTASLIGAVLNARGSIWGFYVWVPANVAWTIYDFYIGQPAQAALFIAYTIITVWGISQWRKKELSKQ